MRRSRILVLLVVASAFVSCRRTDDPASAGTPVPDSPPLLEWQAITPSDSNGVLECTDLAVDSYGVVSVTTRGGGVLRSFDHGATWTPVRTGLRSLDIRFIDLCSAGNVFIASMTDVYRMGRLSTQWTYGGTPAVSIDAFATAPNGWMFVHNDSSGILRTMNGGTSWTLVRTWSSIPTQLNALLVNSYADVYGLPVSGGVIRSTTDGASWTQLATPAPARQYFGLLFLRADVLCAVGDSGTIDRSTDGGTSWHRTRHSGAAALKAIAYNSQGHLLAGDAHGSFVRSLNEGATWDPAPNALAAESITALAVDDQDFAYILTVTGRLYRTSTPTVRWK